MTEPREPQSNTPSAATEAPRASSPPVRPARRKGDQFWSGGEPMVWVTGGALAAVLLGALTLLAVVLYNGLGVFWPARVERVMLTNGTHFLGRRLDSHIDPQRGAEVRFKTANREFDPQRQDFRWVMKSDVAESDYPRDVLVLERQANGEFYGVLQDLKTPGLDLPQMRDPAQRLQEALRAIAVQRAEKLDPLLEQIGAVTEQRREVELAQLKATYRKQQAEAHTPPPAETIALLENQLQELAAEAAALQTQSERLVADRAASEAKLRANVAVFRDSQGIERSVPLVDIVRAYSPNAMGLLGKVGHYLAKTWELLSTPPREANTEGGVLPAIFGTVALILLMALSSFPMGVLAGVYLGEYARDSLFVRRQREGFRRERQKPKRQRRQRQMTTIDVHSFPPFLFRLQSL